MNSNDESSTNDNKPSKQSGWKTCYRNLDAWCERQGWKRCWLFTGGIGVFAALLLCWYFYVKCHPATHQPITCIGSVLTTVLFLVVWALLCFRFRKMNLDGRRLNVPKLLLWWTATVWLSLYVAAAGHAQTPQSTGTNGVALIQKVNMSQSLTSSPKTSPHPGEFYCDALAWFIATIVILGLVLYVLIKICYITGICGHRGNPPPQAPPNNGNGNNGNIVLKGNSHVSAAISTNLPVTVFYLVNGQIVSNSVGLASSTLPSLFDLGGTPVPNDAEVSSSMPGISTPPSIAIWIETNSFSDSVLDPTHPYAAILNYSVLESTNLPDWKELYTIVSWVNNNSTVPLMASIYYTNGIAMTTNWTQMYLDNQSQPTNIVVYGALPSFGAANFQGFKPVKAGPSLPPGGTPIVHAQFYKVVANTNDIQTSWP
jgi:hypothetical protein